MGDVLFVSVSPDTKIGIYLCHVNFGGETPESFVQCVQRQIATQDGNGAVVMTLACMWRVRALRPVVEAEGATVAIR